MSKHVLYLLPIGIAVPFLLFPNTWTPIAFIGIIVCGCAYIISAKHRLVHTPLTAPIMLLLAAASLGRLIAVDSTLADNRFWNIVLQCLAFFLIAQLAGHVITLHRLITLLLMSMLLVEFVAFFGADWSIVRLIDLPIYHFLPNLIPPLPNSGTTAMGLINPRPVGGTAGFIVPFAAGCALWPAFGRMRWLALLVALLGSAIALLSQAPMGILAVVGGLLILAWLHERRLLRAYLAIGSLSIVASSLFLNWRSIREMLIDVNHPLGIAVLLRVDMWRQAVAMLHDMPFTGIGLNNYPVILTYFYPGYLLGPEPHAHNLYLQTALDLGVLGLIAFGLIFGRFLHSAYRANTTAYRPVLYGCIASVSAYLLSGLIDSQVVGQKPILLLWGILGVGVATFKTQTPHEHVAYTMRPIVSSLALVGLMLLSMPAIRTRNVATVLGHQQLMGNTIAQATRSEMLNTVLDSAIHHNPMNPRLYSLRAQVAVQRNQFASAVDDWQTRVVIDQQDPLGRYAPFLAWQADATPSPLAQIYRQWRVRYPDRLEPSVLSALVAAEANDETLDLQDIAQVEQSAPLVDNFQIR